LRDISRTQVINFGNLSTYISTLDSFSPDIVYFFNLMGLGGVALIDATVVAGIPWMMHLMDRLPQQLVDAIPAEILSVFDCSDGELFRSGTVVTMSKKLINEVDTMTGFDMSAEATVVPGWVNGTMIDHSDVSERTRHGRFVFASTLAEMKGVFIALEAFARVSAKYPGVHLDIFGPGDVEPVFNFSANLGIEHMVSIHGQVSREHLYSVYHESDAFLFPTWSREPFGFAPLEAAASGCIPLITEDCGVAERLVDDVHCLKVERNPDAFALAMMRILDESAHVEKMRLAAQQIARDGLSLREAVSAVETHLVTTIETSRSRRARIPSWRQIALAHLKEDHVFDLIGSRE
jgi:glycosyltransferase involved in cell wall biosynthesis